MLPNAPFRSPLARLAARWSLFAMMLVALARQVIAARRQGALGGVRQAELLEAALYTALVQLSADIAAAAKADARASPEDEAALVQLKTVHALLGVTALMTRQLKADLQALAEWLAMLSGAPRALVYLLQAAPLAPPGYLDSS